MKVRWFLCEPDDPNAVFNRNCTGFYKLQMWDQYKGWWIDVPFVEPST